MKSLRRHLPTLVMMALRGGTLVAKFAMTIFVVKLMGLAELGLYGLVASAGTLAPALFGLGLNGPLSRKVVGIPMAQAMPQVSSRLALTFCIYLVAVPVALAANLAAGSPVSPALALLIGATLLGENLATDAHSFLIARHRSMLAAWLMFLRAGAWPLVFMAGAVLWPSWRTMETLIGCWLVALVLLWAVLFLFAFASGQWRNIRFQVPSLLRKAPQSLAYYGYEIGSSCSQYLDRFVVTALMGLETAGIFTFFWSMANAANGLVYFGVTQPFAPRLAGAAKQKDAAAFKTLFNQMMTQAWAWSGILAITTIAAMPFLLEGLGKHALAQYQWLFWLMSAAIVLRTMAEALNLALYAHHRDADMARITIGCAGLSVALTLVMVPLAGLAGAGLAMLFTALVLNLWRERAVARTKA